MQYPSQYGNYTLLESIGEGGMSEIDLAQATVADAQYIRFLVIKRVRGQLLEDDAHIRMFQDEARICAELQHANIAQVYDFGRVNNEFFIAMEYIPGVDLRGLQKALARRGKGIPIRITLRILYDILSALDYAHHRVDTFGEPMNIVHRDVNPRNVMLSVRGEVKLIDFGVAKSSAKQDQTVGHIIKGKFAYMAPEQIEGGAIDGRADIFAAGLMLHEMVEGSRPFHGLSEIQIMHRIISGSIPKLTGPADYSRPKIIHQIHQKALQVEQDERFRTAKDMQKALMEASEHCNGMATPQELAQFLSQNISEQVASISERLHYYRREVTDSLSNAPTALMDSPKRKTTKTTTDSNVSIGPKEDTDFLTINQVAPKLETAEQVYNKSNSNLITFILGIIAILVIGVFIFLLSQKNGSEIQPTQITNLKSVNPEPEISPKNDPAEHVNSKKQGSTSKIVPQKTLTSPKNQQANSALTTNPKENTSSKQVETNASATTLEKETPKENTDKNTIIKEDSQLSVVKETPKKTTTIKEIAPKKETAKVVPPKSVRIFLGVGVESGTKGLPVTIDGRQVTITGSNQQISLTIGTHLLEVKDPKTGTTVQKEITIKEDQKQQIIRISGL